MKYKRKAITRHKSDTTNTKWLNMPSFFSMKFSKRPGRKKTLKGYKKI